MRHSLDERQLGDQTLKNLQFLIQWQLQKIVLLDPTDQDATHAVLRRLMDMEETLRMRQTLAARETSGAVEAA